ncbi:MAG: hypothetical protein JHC33_07960 [Ignisphaera sp.]|nr:hypothetical protein [Ignisphaera sp.]
MPTEYLDLNAELARVQAAKTAPEPTTDPTPATNEEVETPVASEPTTEVLEVPEVSDDETLVSDEIVDPEPTKPEDHRDRAAEKRIAKLIKEREQLKGKLSLYEQQQAPTYETSPEPLIIDSNLPNPANYPDGEADLDYRLDVREYQREQVKKDQTFKEQIQSAFVKYPDLQGLIEADEAKTNPTMAQLIKESPVAVDLFHFLMANPDVSNKIAAMSPAQSAKEIGKIEVRLEEKVKVTTPAPVKKTPPPPPINPVKSSTSVAPSKQIKYTVY